MTQMEFNIFIGNKILECRNILVAKGHDYTDGKDRLSNFKIVAKQCGITPIQVWYVFLTKHLLAIETFVREGEVYSESMEGRFTDAINYLLLGEALMQDLADEDSIKKEVKKIQEAHQDPF